MTPSALLALLPVLPVVAACHVRPESLVPTSARAQAAQRSEALLGRPESFLVLGDSTAFVWPTLLQELLDAHAEERGLYRVLNGAAPADGIGAWTSAPEGAFPALVEDFLGADARLLAGAPPPRTALCLVSLRGLGDGRGPVKSENDMVGAELGADALERLALELNRLGVERVVFGTPPYAAGAEPELALERVAIERLLARGHAFVVAGPDVFRASRRYYPDAYEEDGVQPNEFGLKLVAEEWYRWLAGPEARERVVEALYSEDYDVEALRAAHARARAALSN
jgi:hypothetical protein